MKDQCNHTLGTSFKIQFYSQFSGVNQFQIGSLSHFIQVQHEMIFLLTTLRGILTCEKSQPTQLIEFSDLSVQTYYNGIKGQVWSAGTSLGFFPNFVGSPGSIWFKTFGPVSRFKFTFMLRLSDQDFRFLSYYEGHCQRVQHEVFFLLGPHLELLNT